MTFLRTTARAFAPASVANVAVGFDLLGFSAPITGDTVTVSKTSAPTVTIESTKAPGSLIDLPKDPLLNTATAGLVQLIQDRNLKHGFHVAIEKGIPMGSGLGGSAASSVAGIVAANSLLETSLTKLEMVFYALIGEKVASGSFHADNVAPCLYGGLTLSTLKKPSETSAADSVLGPESLQIEVTELPIPQNLWCVVLHPKSQVETKMARGILKRDLSLETHIKATGHLAQFISALYLDDLKMLGRHFVDDVIEPQRAHLIDGFRPIQNAALASGQKEGDVLGCTISGAGPSIFAWVSSEAAAVATKNAMLRSAPHAMAWHFQLAQNNGARLLT